MAKQIPILLLSLLLSARCFSQLGGLINKAKNKINQRIDRRVDQGMEQTLDKVEGRSPQSEGQRGTVSPCTSLSRCKNNGSAAGSTS